VDFFLSSASGIVVTMPEITAILNAYSFFKTSLFRALFRSFPAKSAERHMIVEFVSKRLEGSGDSFPALQSRLAEAFPETAPAAIAGLGSIFPRVVLNMGKSNRDLAVGARLRDITSRNLGIPIEYIGFTPRDEAVPRSIVERRPVLIARPDSPYAATIRAVARRVVDTPMPAAPRLYQDNEDLVAVAEEGLTAAAGDWSDDGAATDSAV
jgi:flagellar biosynthesis protein FlhG